MLTVTGFQLFRLCKAITYWIRLLGFHSDKLLVAAFYVGAGSNFTLPRVPNGNYQVFFVLGKDWNSKTQSFTKSKKFAKFDKSLNFTTTQTGNRIRYKAYQITLNPVVGGNAKTDRVDEQEFRRYQ